MFKIRSGTRGEANFQGWAKEKFDSETFAGTFCSQQIVEALKTACDASMLIKRSNNRRKANYCWSNNTAELSKHFLKSRSQYQRCRSRADLLTKREIYHQARNVLKNVSSCCALMAIPILGAKPIKRGQT